MDKKDKYKLLQGKSGKELEKIGADLFKRIGLNCCNNLGQIKLNDITSGYPKSENLEFDYLIPEGKICLIGEITGRDPEKDIRDKYKKFIKQINIIKQLDFSRDLWNKLSVQPENIRLFKEIEIIKGFFITTTKEKSDITLSSVDEISVFYKSDFTRLYEYSENIGSWTKNYFLNSFCSENTSDSAIRIPEKSLIKINDIKISKKDIPLANLYTFSISPYKLLDIAHVYRRDEHPSLQSSTYDYQRLLIHEKLKEIREKLLTDQDFIFPSNILVILSKECKFIKDKESDNFSLIPMKYGSLSVIDGQHRLFSYADSDVKSIMNDDCKIMVTAVDFQTFDKQLISESSAKVFVDINANQTKVEISHIENISYELGSDDPKVIARKIIATLNTRDKFKPFFDVEQTKSGIIEVNTIIDTIKKITKITAIKGLSNPRTEKNKQRKSGYENLFNAEISELSERDILVEKGVILLERYFNEVFSVFKQDKPKNKKEPKTSFLFAKFWSGWINLLIVFLDEGSDWATIKDELKKIKNNIIKLREIDNYEAPLFKPDDERIPDSNHSPTKVCKFLYKNRKEPTSIQDINK